MEPSWQHDAEEILACSDESKYGGVCTLLPVRGDGAGVIGDMKLGHVIYYIDIITLW